MTQPLSSKAMFDNLEKLRNHMKLRVEDMLEVVGVSRPGYYGWRNGRKMNSESSAKVLATLRNLLNVCKDSEWKKWEQSHLTNQKRREILHEILTRLSDSSDTAST